MNLPKTVPAEWMRQAKVGSSICCAGHTSYCRTPLVRAGFGFTSNQAWLVLMSSEPPVPVTIITVTEFPDSPEWAAK